MNRILFMLLMLAICHGTALAAPACQPASEKNSARKWKLVEAFSDEFNATKLDTHKWDNDVKSWGAWSWDKKNAYVNFGTLRIRTVYEPHTREGNKYFYTSGIIQSRQTIRYGYFEARVKGASKFPGVCPAFWIKGNEGRVNSEIDFMEIQEVEGNVRQIDCNLHARAMVNGQLEWVRPRRFWIAPWDPRDDFHLYGCEVTPEKIIWYIDGEKILEADNTYWHCPSYLMLSMGLRTPLRRYSGEHAEGNTTSPNAAASTPKGFPTEMQVDYVRVWEPVE